MKKVPEVLSTQDSIICTGLSAIVTGFCYCAYPIKDLGLLLLGWMILTSSLCILKILGDIHIFIFKYLEEINENKENEILCLKKYKEKK